jgi:GNAT superfamily N-acetyltransferase
VKLTARAARPEDRAAVAAISAQIWDGEDYVPEVFDDWVADPRGEFTVFFEGEWLVAFGKVTELRDGEWWLEGLRVDPAQQGRGIARQAHEYAVALADRVASGVLRFATGDYNVAVHHLAELSGFEHVASFVVARAQARPGAGAAHFRPVSATALPAVRVCLQRSASLAAAGGLVEEWWSWQALLPQLPRLVEQGRLLWWDNGRDLHGGLVAFSEDDDEEDRFWVNYAGASETALPLLWRELCELAASRGAATLRARPAATETTMAALARAGWEVEPDHMMRVYARPLPGPARLAETQRPIGD